MAKPSHDIKQSRLLFLSEEEWGKEQVEPHTLFFSTTHATNKVAESANDIILIY